MTGDLLVRPVRHRRLDTGPGDAGPSAVALVPARFTDDPGGYHRFLTALGLVVTDPDGQDVRLRAAS